MNSKIITLGGRDFAIRPLTLRQLRDVLPAFARAAGMTSEDGINAAIDIVVAALSRDHGALARDAILDLESTAQELARAVGAIARLSGLVSEGEPAAGS